VIGNVLKAWTIINLIAVVTGFATERKTVSTALLNAALHQSQKFVMTAQITECLSRETYQKR